MPTYDYECQRCGHEFELFQSMSDEPRKRCPLCRGKVQRLIGTGAGLLFKGGGFYQTDYRSDSYRKAAAADKSAATPAATSAATPAAPSKTESKPKSTES